MSRKIQMFKSSWWIFTIIHSRFLNPQDFVSWMHTKNSYRCRMPSITLVTIGWLHKNWWLRKTFGKNLAADVVKTNTFADKFPRLFHRLVSIHIWEEAQAKPEGGKINRDQKRSSGYTCSLLNKVPDYAAQIANIILDGRMNQSDI